MRIAVFDADITDRHAIGKCQRRFLEALCDVHEFTVFAIEFDNPRPDRIRWIRVPALRRPLALSFLMFHLSAPLCYAWYRLRGGKRFDWIQGIEGNLLFADICYAHFCHRVYLREHGRETRGKGLRGLFNRATNWLQSRVEPYVLRHAKVIVVPSKGLARELHAEYAIPESKIRVLPNPVDIARMCAPASFDRSRTRRELGCSQDDILISFVALGQYERKGLPLLLQSHRIQFQGRKIRRSSRRSSADPTALVKSLSPSRGRSWPEWKHSFHGIPERRSPVSLGCGCFRVAVALRSISASRAGSGRSGLAVACGAAQWR